MTPPDDDAALAPTHDARRASGSGGGNGARDDAALAPTQDDALAPPGAEASQRVATDAGDTAGARMANLRPGAPAGMPLARARVFSALFGDDSTLGKFGRFRVLERLGAGGMGVVYEAYDPDLARGVALKLVDVSAVDRDTALAEAKSLARLSHPNVVPIYDVGIERDQVYLVMELVRGKTLRAWQDQRAPGDILAVYRQAGLALAAAHAVGLVHRDFKPDNAIVGADGRVRVVDFGLACEAELDSTDPAASGPRRVAGTPRYMAPEIRAGMAVTPAADQYSFAVALGEAMDRAQQPPPRRITAAIERGRAADPTARFPSIGELLRVLERDPARTRRRIAAVGGLVAVVGAAAFLVGRQGSAPAAPDPCDQGPTQLADAFAPGARTAALDRLTALGPAAASLRPAIERGLDDHATRWLAQYRTACLERRLRIETDALIERRVTCLARGTDDLAAVGKRLTEVTAAAAAGKPAGDTVLGELTGLARAAQSMHDPDACSYREVLASDVAPPAPELAVPVAQLRHRIAQARMDVAAGRYQDADEGAGSVIAEARGVGYEPALAEALLVQGHARTRLPARASAVPILTEAMTRGLASRDDALGVEAWARRWWAASTSVAEEAAAPSSLDVLEAIAARTRSGFARALLYNNLGGVELARNDRGKARGYLERALVEAGAAPSALELTAIRLNLSLVVDDRARGDRLVGEVIDELTRRLGAEHPSTLDARLWRGYVTTDVLRRADAELAPVCRGFATWQMAARAADCWTEVAMIRIDLGDPAGARVALQAVLQHQPAAEEAQGYTALFAGDPAAAERRFRDALATRAEDPAEPWWRRLWRARMRLGLGRALREARDLRGARDAFAAAVDYLAPVVQGHPEADYERWLGRARADLALALQALGAGAAERAAVALPAAAWLRAAGGPPSEIERLDAAGR